MDGVTAVRVVGLRVLAFRFPPSTQDNATYISESVVRRAIIFQRAWCDRVGVQIILPRKKRKALVACARGEGGKLIYVQNKMQSDAGAGGSW